MAVSITSSSTVLKGLESQIDRLTVSSRTPAQCPILNSVSEDGRLSRWCHPAPVFKRSITHENIYIEILSPGHLSSNQFEALATMACERSELNRNLATDDVENQLDEILATASPLLEAASALCSIVDSTSQAHVSGIGAVLTLAAVLVHLLHDARVPEYVDVAKSVNHLNKILAAASPLLEAASAVSNIMDSVSGSHISSPFLEAASSFSSLMDSVVETHSIGSVLTLAEVFVHSASQIM